MASDKRPPITLVCTETGDHNYVTTKNKTNTPDRLELMKYSPRLRKHTLHREKRQKNQKFTLFLILMENIAKLNHFGEDVSNSELVKKSQLGDKSAFEELVKRHQELVFSLSFKLTGNRELANDVAQEAFIRAWKAIGKFEVTQLLEHGFTGLQ